MVEEVNAQPLNQEESDLDEARRIADDLANNKMTPKQAWIRVRKCSSLLNFLKKAAPGVHIQSSIQSFLFARTKTEFLPAGTSKKVRKKMRKGILQTSNDWQVHCDLPEFLMDSEQFVFPHWVCPTDLKPDCYLISERRKVCVIIELTSPWDINLTNGTR